MLPGLIDERTQKMCGGIKCREGEALHPLRVLTTQAPEQRLALVVPPRNVDVVAAATRAEEDHRHEDRSLDPKANITAFAQ